MAFKENFVWGAATASYQIEGAAYEDGKGLSVWDTFSHEPGKVFEGNTGDVACDHYHRYKEDVDLMKSMGLQAYRMSISWPRVLPKGIGKINEKGLDFYDRLIDSLLEKGIDPYVTLFHWDFPYELYKKGGWLNSDSADWFAEYTQVIVDKLSDRVTHWMTINEPQCYIGLGHQTGSHAPGLQMGARDYMQASHNTLLAHGKSVQVIRAFSKKTPRIGLAPATVVVLPDALDEKSIEAARYATFDLSHVDSVSDLGWTNSFFMDPIFLGKYPEKVIEIFGKYLPEHYQEDLKIISGELDFFACNIYTGRHIVYGKDGKPQIAKRAQGHAVTGFNWAMTPDVLYWGAKFFYERYKKPIIIAENGLSSKDWVSLDGKVHDQGRIDYVIRYLSQLKKAASEGVDIEAYFHWTLMDNFEWAAGYRERFGLIHVDFETGKRTLKESAFWYKNVIETNGNHL